MCALGQLNRPFTPTINGHDAFGGQTVHSARWDSVPIDDANVAIIGSAASAVQIIPEIAPRVKHLTVFQRTPNWVFPRQDREVTLQDKALMIVEPRDRDVDWCAQPECDL